LHVRVRGVVSTDRDEGARPVEGQRGPPNRRGSAAPDLVPVPEQLKPGLAAAIIKLVRRQDRRQRALAGLGVADHRDTNVSIMQVLGNRGHHHLGRHAAQLVGALPPDRRLGLERCRHPGQGVEGGPEITTG